MSLFDTLVDTALTSQATLNTLRPVVEKEILHHDIIREMNQAGLLQGLTFIGGTCLRACYGSNRLSEDLDFTGGADFRKTDLVSLKDILTTRLQTKYELPVTVSDPKAEKQGNVQTWKLQINTRPQRPDLAAQHIHLDICAVPSYQATPQTLRNPYGLDLGTHNLIINAQSRREIFADKLIAFAMRPNRIKNRDLWDITWLTQAGVRPACDLLEPKLANRAIKTADFLEQSHMRIQQLQSDPDTQTAFTFEMRRFLPPDIINRTVAQSGFWPYVANTVTDCIQQAKQHLHDTPGPEKAPDFLM